MICAVCNDSKDVRKHYGVNCCYGCKGFFRRSVNEERNYICSNGGNCQILKENRNRCRACRFQKCLSVGMDGNQLRDTKSQPKSSNISSLPNLTASTSASSPRNAEVDPASLDLINFLTSMTKASIEAYDPRYENVEAHEWLRISQEKCNREITLFEGIKNPEKVCPRTKWDFSCSRPAGNHDLSFMWYRTFVSVADWANCIPEFRMLSEEDQVQLFRMNFILLSCLPFIHLFEMKFNVLPLGNGSYFNVEDFSMAQFSMSIINAYIQHIVNPLKEVNTDASELALLYSIYLFQYYESLSPEGKRISKNYVDRLYDALFDYQVVKFPKISPKERTRRQTKILMIMTKISQIWAIESDMHLVMSTFDEVNIDGIPKELLFHRFGSRT